MPISAAFSTCSGVPPITAASEGTCGHGAGHAHLALAAHLGTRKRCVDLVNDADGARSEQKVAMPASFAPGRNRT